MEPLHERQGLLQDRLKDQVAVSIKESLCKATTVLSSLHRVHSYLDVLRSLPSLHSGGGGEGLKSALEQVRAIRTDTAALLQTIYLTEIGLQSLEQVDRPTTTVDTPSSDVVLGDSINNSPLSDDVENHAINSNDDIIQGRAVVELPSQPEEDPLMQAPSEATNHEEHPPPAKKQNVSILITKCTSCSRKFATDQLGSQQEGRCKNCRSGESPSTPQAPTTPLIKCLIMSGSNSGGPPISASTPSRPRLNPGGKKTPKSRRVSGTPLACKVCGTSFVYRRCLFRHLRENHPGIDLNSIHNYIEMEKRTTGGEVATPESEPGSQNTSMNVTVGSEVAGSEVTRTSEVNESSIIERSLSDVVPGQVLDGDGTETVQQGVEQGAESDTTTKGEGGTAVKQVFTCDICGKVFDRPYRLTRHFHIHDPNRPRVSCQLCDRSFTRFDTLENHMKSSHSDERPFKCQYTSCSKSFATQTALVGHLKVHTNGKPYQCLECNASFSLLVEYKTHIKQAHADTEGLRCSDCYRLFPDSASLDDHRSVEHLLECEICGKTFARLAYLQLHVQVHSGESVYNCKVCSRGFDSESAYRQHMKTHPRSKGKRFHCQLCDKSFEAPSNLIEHYRCQEHREKAAELGIGVSTTILNTIEGDMSDMNALVEEVAMGTPPISMETTPVAMPTGDTMETKQMSSVETTNPGGMVLGEMDHHQETTINIISSLTDTASF